MQFINTSDIALGSAMPYQKSMIDWLQLDEYRTLRAFASGILGTSIQNYNNIVWVGCLKTGTTTFTITSGFILKPIPSVGGVTSGIDLIECSGATITPSVGQVIVGTISDFYPLTGTSDPVTFSDGSTHNVHARKIITWSAGTSGSGDLDFDDLVFLQNPTRQVGTIATAQWEDGAGGSTFNYYKVPFNKLVIDTQLQKASSGTATIITLPVGYRPASDRYFTTFGGTVNPTTLLKFKIATTGAVTFEQGAISSLGVGVGDIYNVYAEIPLY